MTPTNPNPDRDRLDGATARRLGRLRTMPVELAGIRRAIEAEVGPPAASLVAPTRRGAWRITWPGPMRAAAASLLVFGLIAAAVIAVASRPAVASADRLAEIHAGVQQRDGICPCPVESIAEANAVLSAHTPAAPRLPEVPADDVHFCCLQKLGRREVACAAVVVDGQPVTVAVADARHVRAPPGDARVVDGQPIYVHARGDLNMVMTSRDGRWVCVMGRVPADRLVEMARNVRP